MANKDFRPSINLDGVKNERVRKVVDLSFKEVIDELDESYYGDRNDDGSFKRDGNSGWKFGKSSPFRGLDIYTSMLTPELISFLGASGQSQLTSEQSTKLHQALQGAMNHAYLITIIKANRKLLDKYDEDEINPLQDLSKDRLFKNAIENKRKKFESLLRNPSTSVTTFKDLVDLYNSIPIEVGNRGDELTPVMTKIQKAISQVRLFEKVTGIKVRSLVGTLPEE